ncbi:hypothetical protein E4U24_002100 [Claviceps purpurea]|nr:hypothetical protein E4U50_002993 [Claviceps purpurea]KAG6249488.1 hypothetical protein E4U24_002100 [Claviceps purpurea]
MADMAINCCDEPIGSHNRTRTNDSHHHHHQPGSSELEANAAAATVHVQPTAPPIQEGAETTTAAPLALPQAKEIEVGLLPLNPGPASLGLHQPSDTSAMLFSDFYRSPRSPLSKLRIHHFPPPAHFLPSTPEWVSDEYADLLSRDKTKQKNAVKRYLADKVRNDWTFTWPPTPQPPLEDAVGDQKVQGTEIDEAESGTDEGDVDADDAESIYSVVSEDATHYRPRIEWTSDLSDIDDEEVTTRCSPFRLDMMSAAQSTVQEIMEAKKARRRRAVREEISWNDGLACFEARRDAWTGAKTVRLHRRPVATPPASPRSPRRFFSRRSISSSPPGPASPSLATNPGHVDNTTAISVASSSPSKGSTKDLTKHANDASSAVSESSHGQVYPVEIMLPIGQPILPPSNPLRASISPTVYLSLYDKVILHNLQPACPVNLSDMLRSCVAGWKRDGEWPPRSSVPEPTAAVPKKKKKRPTTSSPNEQAGNATRRMSLGLLGGGDNHGESGPGKGIRRSLQRALGIGGVAGVEGRDNAGAP